MIRALEIAIAGAGPAGLAAALLLVRDGHRVTLFERFEAPRPIGSGLMIQPTGLAVLKRLGLADALIAQGARIERLFGRTPRGRTVLDVRYRALGSQSCFGVGVHRATLFHLLHEAVRAAGVPIETGRAIAASEVDGGGRRRLRFEGGGTAGPFDLLVDTCGTRSPLADPCGRTLAYGALWASLDWPGTGFAGDALEQRYRRASTMAGVLPIGTLPGAAHRQAAFFWSIRCDRIDGWRAAGLDAWKEEVLALWPETTPLLTQITAPEQLTEARYRHRTLPRPAAPAMIHLGDAWHSTSPQLGQGANMALLDAWALARALRTRQEIADALTEAVRRRRRHVWLYQAMSALFTPVYQSDSRLLSAVRDLVVGPLSTRWPTTWLQAAMVSGLVGDPLGPVGLD